MNKVIHNDCFKYLETIPDNSIDMVLTDPPYNITKADWDNGIDLKLLWTHLNRVIKPNSAMVFTAAQPFTSKLVVSNISNFKYNFVWKKPPTNQLNTSWAPMKNTEDVLVFSNGKPKFYPQFSKGKPYTRYRDKGDHNHIELYGSQKPHKTVNTGTRYPMQILEFGHDKDRYHPTQKPINLFQYLIKTFTEPNGLILDPFAGAGTAAAAALTTHRRYILIEKDPKYFQIILDRIKKTQIPLF